jgi:hypothetical protein
MSVPRTVTEVIRRHVTLEVEGIDRMYLNVYQPRLQCEGQVAAFFRSHRGHPFASSALMDPMSKAFIASVERFVQENQALLLTFAKGQRKDRSGRRRRKPLASSRFTGGGTGHRPGAGARGASTRPSTNPAKTPVVSPAFRPWSRGVTPSGTAGVPPLQELGILRENAAEGVHVQNS